MAVLEGAVPRLRNLVTERRIEAARRYSEQCSTGCSAASAIIMKPALWDRQLLLRWQFVWEWLQLPCASPPAALAQPLQRDGGGAAARADVHCLLHRSARYVPQLRCAGMPCAAVQICAICPTWQRHCAGWAASAWSPAICSTCCQHPSRLQATSSAVSVPSGWPAAPSAGWPSPPARAPLCEAGERRAGGWGWGWRADGGQAKAHG